MIRFGTNPIAWSNDDDRSIGAHISLEQCLSEAGHIGFDGIENGHKFPSDPVELRAKLEPNGLAFVSAWYSLNLLANPLEDEIAAIDPHLDLLLAMDCSVCIACETSNSIHGAADLPLSRRPLLAQGEWTEFGARVEAVAEHVRTRGLDLVYHPHMGTVVQTPQEYDLLMRHTGPATRLLFDTGHCYFGGGDPAEVLARHVDRHGHLHCKNVRRAVMDEVLTEDLAFIEGVRRGVFTVPGDPEGAVDFAAVLEVVAAAGYDGWLVIEAEQDSAVRDPAEYQSMGLNSLRMMARDAGLIE